MCMSAGNYDLYILYVGKVATGKLMRRSAGNYDLTVCKEIYWKVGVY